MPARLADTFSSEEPLVQHLLEMDVFVGETDPGAVGKAEPGAVGKAQAVVKGVVWGLLPSLASWPCASRQMC